METTTVLQPILKVTFHHFFCGLFVRSEPVSPAHTQGAEITKSYKYRR